jgi:accessory secretory protein Asp2
MHDHGIANDDCLSMVPELSTNSENIELEFRVVLLNRFTGEIVRIVKGSADAFRNQEVLLTNTTGDALNIGVSLYVKGGEGEIEMGQLHFRHHLDGGDYMMAGGKRIVDHSVRNEELFQYFYPGDMKPPLAVYFSGYRSAEGFEGRGMMGQMDCPFLLIGDPRLEGGNFYLGSQDLENQVVAIIREKLALLGFNNHQLILSGLSMGTFASLYYAPDLQPGAVIVGKPLTNIGTIAMNERINRPESWGTSLDMVLHFGGKSENQVAEQLNRRFWDKFSKAHFTDTIFALAYMLNDDYDKEAFPMIQASLREHSPKAVVLHKGFVGRHNDDTYHVNSWFVKQYRNILWTSFNRHINYRF